MKKLKIGVIGCGWVAQNFHIPNYINHPDVDLIALCDLNNNLLSNLKEKYNIKYCFNDYNELFKKNIIDAVSICTPTSSHAKIAINAAENNLHILCEKPIATSLDETNEILQIINNRDIKFMVGFNYRFLPNHRKMREYIMSGRIGQPISVRGEVFAAGPYRDDISKNEYPYETKKRIGALFDLGSHIADLFIWIFGRIEEVSASFSTHMEYIDVDDVASVSLKFKSGILGSIIVGWLNIPDYYSMNSSRLIEVIGNKGKIESDFFGPSLHFYSSSSLISKIKGTITITPRGFDPKIPYEALNYSYRQEINSFINSIKNNKEPPITGQQAKEALKFVLAAYQSKISKSTIILEK